MCKEKLIRHHVKYKEIHGVDEIVMMTRSEHQKLHIRLRQEGKCNIPSNELRKISNKAYEKTFERKEYNKNNQKRKSSHTTYGKNVLLHEQIIYNIQTGTITYSAGFKGNNGKKLLYIDIN